MVAFVSRNLHPKSGNGYIDDIIILLKPSYGNLSNTISSNHNSNDNDYMTTTTTTTTNRVVVEEQWIIIPPHRQAERGEEQLQPPVGRLVVATI